jgi:hypothetical protein
MSTIRCITCAFGAPHDTYAQVLIIIPRCHSIHQISHFKEYLYSDMLHIVLEQFFLIRDLQVRQAGSSVTEHSHNTTKTSD